MLDQEVLQGAGLHLQGSGPPCCETGGWCDEPALLQRQEAGLTGLSQALQRGQAREDGRARTVGRQLRPDVFLVHVIVVIFH